METISSSTAASPALRCSDKATQTDPVPPVRDLEFTLDNFRNLADEVVLLRKLVASQEESIGVCKQIAAALAADDSSE